MSETSQGGEPRPEGHYWVKVYSPNAEITSVGHWDPVHGWSIDGRNYAGSEVDPIGERLLLPAESERVSEQFDIPDAFALRAIVSNWLGCDEVVIAGNANSLAREILRALDAVAIVHGNAHATEDFDRKFAALNRL